jgi:ABC-2 type transport system ATP-binding protein
MQPDSQPLSERVDAVRTTNLVKDFGGKVAVDGLTLRVPRGTFFGFLGPNGAGKSTTIKMLTGLLAPTSGSIEILGLDFSERPVDVKRQIGVVPEDLALFDRLTGYEYLRFVAGMYGLSNAVAAERADQLLAVMRLDGEPKKLVVDYSHGMKKKVSLAAALIHGPKLLFLDEPFEGVDAIAAKVMKDMLNTMIGRGATIFLTSHVLDIVERLCTHVAIIDRGKLVAQGSVEELRAGVAVDAGGHDDGDLGVRRTLTLEEIFVATVGGADTRPERTLSWLAE